MLNLRKRHMVQFFKQYINPDLDRHIADRLLHIITIGFTVNNVSYSVYDIIKTNKTLAVIIEVKCFDYELKRRCKGYFALEYGCVEQLGYVVFNRYSRSMPMEFKLAADIPYGGWWKDKRQAEEEDRYFRKQYSALREQQSR